MEALVAIGACLVLIALVATATRDKKLRFRRPAPQVTASATPAASASPAGSPTPVASPTPAIASSDIQTLFTQGRAESSLIAPVERPNTDFANGPTFQPIREADLGRMYSSAPKKNRRALAKVASLGGFRTAEEMALAFGYPSVDQMLWTWEQAIAEQPKFPPSAFGTNARPVILPED